MAGAAIKGLFVQVSRDPRIIPGVHQYCDEWCARCALTDRCLAFRGTAIYRKARGRRDSEPTFADTADAIEFTRELAATEGLATPELDTLLAAGRASPAFRTDDPLADVAWEYALGVSLWLVFTPEDLRRFAARPTPPPEEVVLWHHLRIYLKLVRALVAKERTRSGYADRTEDANGCAKLTLVAVRQSRQAMLQIKGRGGQSRSGTLLSLLDTLERGIDERFPEARAFVRVGLDVPATP